MQKNQATQAKFSVVLSLFVISGCVSVEMDLQQLLPEQVNQTDGSGLEFTIITESVLVEREYSDTRHRRVERFPPRVILFVRADRQFAGREVSIREMRLNGPDGFSVDLATGTPSKLTLKTIEQVRPGEYEGYTQLLFNGGTAYVRAVHFSERIDGVEAGKNYELVLDYRNLDGEPVELRIQYEATHSSGDYSVPEGLPRT